ncbi:MAG: DUF1957 domain-containing protein [Polyangiaceae bacterium]|nr:DUF1957 domain-containing protein [Polyangiaceae bacterium]
MSDTGAFALVLHTHLPYVRHPEHERPIEERWLHEALIECYLPLLDALDRLDSDGVRVRATMSLTAPLAEMLRDDLLRARFDDHLARLDRFAARVAARRAYPAEFDAALGHARGALIAARARWDRIGGDVVGALVGHARRGSLQLLASSATHAFLPGLLPRRPSLRAQLRLGVAAFERQTGLSARGLWLPECGYDPGFDGELAAAGVRMTIVDGHALLRASRRPPFGVHAPVLSPSGVAFFGRDDASSRQVWAREVGYPGALCYRDFYRDAGFDLDEALLDDQLGPFGVRLMSGLKLHRITERGPRKLHYIPDIARGQAARDAAHFVGARRAQLGDLAATLPVRPLVVAPYDTELFGHWWAEGPWFLEAVFRELAAARDVEPVTLQDALAGRPALAECTPSASSWGKGGYGEVWLDGESSELWRHVHHASREVERLVATHRRAEGLPGRALDLAVRELLLLQSSDFPFILHTGGMVEYARARVRSHVARVWRLSGIVTGERPQPDDERWVEDVDARDAFLRDLPSEALRAAFE